MGIKEFVYRLSEEDKHRIVKDYIQFEEDGFIGDCLLRSKTVGFFQSTGIFSECNMILYMKEIYTWCLRWFYEN